MSAPLNGGPAFPYAFHLPDAPGEPFGVNLGMTLRDWFAGKAIQGILANGSPTMIALGVKEAKERGETRTEETWSRWAYEIADAMLRERSKQ